MNLENQAKEYFKARPYLIDKHRKNGWKYGLCWKQYPERPTDMSIRLQKSYEDALKDKEAIINEDIKKDCICIITL